MWLWLIMNRYSNHSKMYNHTTDGYTNQTLVKRHYAFQLKWKCIPTPSGKCVVATSEKALPYILFDLTLPTSCSLPLNWIPSEKKTCAAKMLCEPPYCFLNYIQLYISLWITQSKLKLLLCMTSVQFLSSKTGLFVTQAVTQGRGCNDAVKGGISLKNIIS